MPTITGALNDLTLNGGIKFSADHFWIDTSTKPDTIVIAPYEAPITNGQFKITVPQSKNIAGIRTEGITYKVELWVNTTVSVYQLPDNSFYTGDIHIFGSDTYTGLVHDKNSQKLTVTNTVQKKTILNFHAIVPETATPTEEIEIGALIAVSQGTPYLDITTRRIAQLLTEDPYRDKISSKLNLKGQWKVDQAYSFGDVVNFNGNSYGWRKTTGKIGQQPPMTGEDEWWALVASKGDSGGSKAQIVGYNPATWKGSNEPASRQDVIDAIASVGQINLSDYYTKREAAPRANPVFSGSVQRDILPYPSQNKAVDVPTAQYVEDAINALGIAKIPTPILFAQQTKDVIISDFNKNTPIPWSVVPIGLNTGSGGVITQGTNLLIIPETGSYLMYLQLNYYTECDYIDGSGKLTYTSLISTEDDKPYGTFWKADNSYTINTNAVYNGWRFLPSLKKGDKYQISVQLNYTKTLPVSISPRYSVFSLRKILGVFDNSWIVWKVS